MKTYKAKACVSMYLAHLVDIEVTERDDGSMMVTSRFEPNARISTKINGLVIKESVPMDMVDATLIVKDVAKAIMKYMLIANNEDTYQTQTIGEA